MENRYQQLAKYVRWKLVTNSLSNMWDGKPLRTACQLDAMENRYQQLAKYVR